MREENDMDRRRTGGGRNPEEEEENETLLSIQGLRTSYLGPSGPFRAVDGVDLSVARGEVSALVGESGCGKTALALSILRLLPEGRGWIEEGKILFHGQDLVSLPETKLRRVRGNRIAMIFQEPTAALNPVMRVGEQVAEAFRVHCARDRRKARRAAVEMMRRVGIPDPEHRADDYPHRLSGGMRQRVMIAMALVTGPELVIADEPTTAVDVTVQAQVLELLDRYRRERGTSVLLITHDFSVVSEMADRVSVMYAAGIVEQGPVRQVLDAPFHPYTQGLLRSLPHRGGGRLEAIEGGVPDPACLPPGCPFHPRCGRARERCTREAPLLRRHGEGRRAACHFPL